VHPCLHRSSVVCGTPVSEVSVFGVDIWLAVQKFIRPSRFKLLLIQYTEVLKMRCKGLNWLQETCMNVGCFISKIIGNSASSLRWTVGLAVVAPFAATNRSTWEFFMMMQLGLGNSTSGETRYVPVITSLSLVFF
jgi:hypothetical protein